MNSFFSIDSSSEVFHGDYFSVFVDRSDFYWVVSNDYPTVFKGPLDKGSAWKLMTLSNEFYNLFILKGLLPL